MGGTGVSMGVMTKGSVIVNGVRYEDTTANISIDDTPKTAANLQNGMVVSVRGTIDGSGRNGTAQTVDAVVEVRGLVTSKDAVANPQRFVVFGQTVIVDDLTVYSNITFAAIVANTTIVEVHGLRDVSGNIRATREEANQGPLPLPDGSVMADPLVDEIRGTVTNGVASSNPITFSLGTQSVAVVPGAQIVGGPYSNGSIVEVHCVRSSGCIVGNVFQASRIEVEDRVNLPGNGQRFEVEGLISGFALHPGDFLVAGIPVTTTNATSFRGGIADDLLNNMKVEAEGSWNGTRLVANKIEFKRSVVRLQGLVTAHLTNSAGSTFTLTAAGRAVIVETDEFTTGDFLIGNLPPVGPNCVQVRGQRKAGGGIVVTAGEIKSNCSNSGRHFIQAQVDAESPEDTITLLGLAPINVSNPTRNAPNKWVNTADVGISRTEFFNAVIPASVGPPPVAGTLVKVVFDTPAVVVHQVELED